MKKKSMRFWHSLVKLASLVTLAGEAHATGGLSCTVDDANMSLNADTAVSRGMGGQFISFKAEAEIKAREVPDALRKLTLDSALIHHWYTGNEIKLSFYKETEAGDHASVDISIETKLPEGAEEDAALEGEYELRIFGAPPGGGEAASTVLRGRASCLSE
jgi:hypothetical protein